MNQQHTLKHQQARSEVHFLLMRSWQAQVRAATSITNSLKSTSASPLWSKAFISLSTSSWFLAPCRARGWTYVPAQAFRVWEQDVSFAYAFLKHNVNIWKLFGDRIHPCYAIKGYSKNSLLNSIRSTFTVSHVCITWINQAYILEWIVLLCK